MCGYIHGSWFLKLIFLRLTIVGIGLLMGGPKNHMNLQAPPKSEPKWYTIANMCIAKKHNVRHGQHPYINFLPRKTVPTSFTHTVSMPSLSKTLLVLTKSRCCTS